MGGRIRDSLSTENLSGFGWDVGLESDGAV
jgi:hypothetical protein